VARYKPNLEGIQAPYKNDFSLFFWSRASKLHTCKNEPVSIYKDFPGKGKKQTKISKVL
jgi:hypothetical protein